MTNPLNASQDAVHRSPPLGLVAVVFVGLFVGSIAANFLMTGGAPYPIPYKPIEELQNYYTRFPEAMRVVSFLQFGAYWWLRSHRNPGIIARWSVCAVPGIRIDATLGVLVRTHRGRNCQSFGGKDIPQMFRGVANAIPQCRGFSGST